MSASATSTRRTSRIDEPLPAEDVEGYARLCAQVPTPIQAGESWWSPAEAECNIEARACDLAMPDVARVGGVTGTCAPPRRRTPPGLKVSTHNYPEVGLDLLAAAPNAHLLERRRSAGRNVRTCVYV